MGLVPLQGLLPPAFARIGLERVFSARREVDFPLASQWVLVIGFPQHGESRCI
jgi:hypothetical protein